MAINRDGTASKPGDWAGGGAGGGVYQAPTSRASYDSRGSKLTDFSGNAYKGPGGNGRGGNAFADLSSFMSGGKGQPNTPIVNQPVAAVPPALQPVPRPRPKPVIGQPISGVPVEPVDIAELGGIPGYIRNPDGTYSQYRPTAGYPTPPSSFNPNPGRFAGNVADYRTYMRGQAGEGYTGW